MCDWGYCKHNGPSKWGENFPAALGPRQSPIDIQSGDCQEDNSLPSTPLRMEYELRGKLITNTGAGWRVNFNSGSSLLDGGPLKHKYKLEQFHIHWGKDETEGSEHTVDGNTYPAELHLVHWNSDKYATFGEAVDKEDGLAVLGVFFEIGDEHPELAKLVELLHRIPHSGDNCFIEREVDPMAFIPKRKSYWTYPGSLTTPPCLESVDWIVFKEPLQISEKQLSAFRQLLSYARLERTPETEFEGKVIMNYRPPLELGNRTVRTCDLEEQ